MAGRPKVNRIFCESNHNDLPIHNTAFVYLIGAVGVTGFYL